MNAVWLQYLQQGKHLYLNSYQHLKEQQLDNSIFEQNFIQTDRKQSLKNIKPFLKPLSYTNFLNKYRVYKSRVLCDSIDINITKSNFNSITALTKKLGYQTNNETIELLCQYYAENQFEVH